MQHLKTEEAKIQDAAHALKCAIGERVQLKEEWQEALQLMMTQTAFQALIGSLKGTVMDYLITKIKSSWKDENTHADYQIYPQIHCHPIEIKFMLSPDQQKILEVRLAIKASIDLVAQPRGERALKNGLEQEIILPNLIESRLEGVLHLNKDKKPFLKVISIKDCIKTF